MKSDGLKALMKKGEVEQYPKGQVFYSLDFKEKLYVVNKGYVNRYQVTADKKRVIESIYGPGYIFPLTQVYKSLLNFDLSQESITYVYQGMTDTEIQGIDSKLLSTAVEASPALYSDLFYEAGRRLKANINRLASNALKDDYQKIAHQLVCLADEFGELKQRGTKQSVKILAPLEPIDMAEQLNISVDVADAVINRLEKQGLLVIDGDSISISDVALLKDAYL
jgi:CRP-like cAMP-binding protein